jgi:hypothetical protein
MDSDSDDLYDPSDSVPTGGQPKVENAEEIEEDDSDDVSSLSRTSITTC